MWNWQIFWGMFLVVWILVPWVAVFLEEGAELGILNMLLGYIQTRLPSAIGLAAGVTLLVG